MTFHLIRPLTHFGRYADRAQLLMASCLTVFTPNVIGARIEMAWAGSVVLPLATTFPDPTLVVSSWHTIKAMVDLIGLLISSKQRDRLKRKRHGQVLSFFPSLALAWGLFSLSVVANPKP